MAYRQDLGLWAPAVGEQCIVYSLYWLDSSADVCVCVLYWLAQLQYLQFHDQVGTAFSSIPAAKSSQYFLHF